MRRKPGLVALSLVATFAAGCEENIEAFEQTSVSVQPCVELIGSYGVHDGARVLIPAARGVVDVAGGVTYDLGFEALLVTLALVEGEQRGVIFNAMGETDGSGLRSLTGLLGEAGEVHVLAEDFDPAPLDPPAAQRLAFLGLPAVPVVTERFALPSLNTRAVGLIGFDADSLARARADDCAGRECVRVATLAPEDQGTLTSLALGHDGTGCWTFLPPMAHTSRRVACGECGSDFTCTRQGDSEDAALATVVSLVEGRAALAEGASLRLWGPGATTTFREPSRADLSRRAGFSRLRLADGTAIAESAARYRESQSAVIQVNADGSVRWARALEPTDGSVVTIFGVDDIRLLTIEESGDSCRMAVHRAE